MPTTWGSLVWILHTHHNALIFAPRTRLSQLSRQTAPTRYNFFPFKLFPTVHNTGDISPPSPNLTTPPSMPRSQYKKQRVYVSTEWVKLFFPFFQPFSVANFYTSIICYASVHDTGDISPPAQLQQCLLQCPADNIRSDESIWAQGKKISPFHFLQLFSVANLYLFLLFAMRPSMTLWISRHPAQIQQRHLELPVANIKRDEVMWVQGKQIFFFIVCNHFLLLIFIFFYYLRRNSPWHCGYLAPQPESNHAVLTAS